MPAHRPFHLMAKPSGPACNLACTYCFYIERWDQHGVKGMGEEQLEAYVREYIHANPAPEVNFSWQGGEPTLRGLDFFRRAVELQKKHCPPDKKVVNAFQTNGLLLDDGWCEFLAKEKFLVGLSCDGPPEVHDARRFDRGGKPTGQRVIDVAALMVRHGVEFNLLCVVGSHNADRPRQVYRFLKKLGTAFIQFIPLIERRTATSTSVHDYAPPPEQAPEAALDPVSIQPQAWGEFLCAVFDEWVQADVGRVYIRDFDNWLGLWLNMPTTLCVHGETCGDALVIEADGSVYSCDHFVYPEYRLGRVGETPLAEMIDSAQQRGFGDAKRDRLPLKCRSCRWLKLCHGGCPKHIFSHGPGQVPAPHLCAGWMRFFDHAAPAFNRMAELLNAKRAPAEIMTDVGVLRALGLTVH